MLKRVVISKPSKDNNRATTGIRYYNSSKYDFEKIERLAMEM